MLFRSDPGSASSPAECPEGTEVEMEGSGDWADQHLGAGAKTAHRTRRAVGEPNVFYDPSGERLVMVPLAARSLGISGKSLYRHVRLGKVPAEKRPGISGQEFIVIRQSEVDRLGQLQAEKRFWDGLPERLAQRRGIDEKSARRWLQRQRACGRHDKEILEKVSAMTGARSGAMKRHRTSTQ